MIIQVYVDNIMCICSNVAIENVQTEHTANCWRPTSRQAAVSLDCLIRMWRNRAALTPTTVRPIGLSDPSIAPSDIWIRIKVAESFDLSLVTSYCYEKFNVYVAQTPWLPVDRLSRNIINLTISAASEQTLKFVHIWSDVEISQQDPCEHGHSQIILSYIEWYK